MFKFVMILMERYYKKELKNYVDDSTRDERYRVNTDSGVAIYEGNRHMYTLSRANATIYSTESTIKFDNGLSVTNKNGDSLLFNKDEAIKQITDAIQWKDGRNDKCKNMMIGNYKISSNVIQDTFDTKKKLLIEAIKKVL